MITPDYHNEPWKHPAVWRSHVVRMTRDCADGATFSVATCECGWTNRIKIERGGAGYVDQDDAVNAHWLATIAAAEKSPA
jgi:hypothetical protein